MGIVGKDKTFKMLDINTGNPQTSLINIYIYSFILTSVLNRAIRVCSHFLSLPLPELAHLYDVMHVWQETVQTNFQQHD